MTMDRTNTFLHAMPATPLAESTVWRVDIQWHEHVMTKRFDVTDIKERGRFIREWCDKCGVPWEHALWLDSAMDEEIREWQKRNEEIETLDKRVTLLLTRVNDQEKEIRELTEGRETITKRLDRLAAFCETLRQERKARKDDGNGSQV